MYDELIRDLDTLKLRYLASHLNDFIASVTKARTPPLAIIEQIAKRELEEAKKRSLISRLNTSKVNAKKWRPLADFDWSWPKNIDRAAVERLFELNFLDEPANAIFMGPSSLGKTMIARYLFYPAVQKGHQAIFVEASALLSELEDIDSARQLHSRLKYSARPKLLVIDEIGYLSFSARAGDLLFQVISQRYEKAATIVTTNVSFKDWGKIFPQAACVSALLERLLHRAEIITIEGDSYRMKEDHERSRKAKGTKSKEPK